LHLAEGGQGREEGKKRGKAEQKAKIIDK